MANKELDLIALNKVIEEAEKRKQELLEKQSMDATFEETLKALSDDSDTEDDIPGEKEPENQVEQPEQTEELTKKVGKVKAQFRGRIVKRGDKWAYFELDSRWCRYNPETTLSPRILININGEADPDNPGQPFKDTFVIGFDYNIICDLSVDIDRKTKKVVNRFWLRRFAIIVDDV